MKDWSREKCSEKPVELQLRIDDEIGAVSRRRPQRRQTLLQILRLVRAHAHLAKCKLHRIPSCGCFFHSTPPAAGTQEGTFEDSITNMRYNVL